MKLLWIPLFCLVFTAVTADEIDTLWDDYVAMLETLDKYGHGDPTLIDQYNWNSSAIHVEARFTCTPSVSPEKPTSVNKLRPGDIDVIGALGDSLTAANGAGAKTLIGVVTQYRGLAAGIGGDKDLSSTITLPNIMKHYNEEIYGYSVGTGNAKKQNSRLNVAVPGAVADKMPDQARELVKRLRTDPSVDFDNDWKLVTLFVGGNDLCRQCKYPDRFSPENYVLFVEEAIMILSEVPRMFVNVIGIVDAYHVHELSSFVCDILHQVLCPCGMTEERREMMKQATEKYQTMLHESINQGKYDRDDFAAVFQPFFLETELPRHEDGLPDYSFFAPDCFHLSEKGQGAQAIATWNNMIQPVGSKDRSWTPGENVSCPSKDFPYLYTNRNSKASWNPEESEEVIDDPPKDDVLEGDDQHVEQGGPQEDEQEQEVIMDRPALIGNEGGLSGGVIALIVISVVVVTGVVIFFVTQRKRPLNQYQQLQ